MNIFVTDPSPTLSARCLPDKHIVKMPLETCQMLSIVCSKKWGHGYGELHRINGEPYKTEKGAFRNHPCTIWANQCLENTWWLLALEEATTIIPSAPAPYLPTSFTFAGPDEFKYDTSIDTFTAYKRYISSKPWAASNYLRDPSRKPHWL